MIYLKRGIGALLTAAPGAALVWLYARRIVFLRDNPALSPGTPAETWTAAIVMIVATAAFTLAFAIARGRINRALGASGFMSLAVVTLVMSVAFVRVPGA